MLQRVPPEGGYKVIADDVEDGWRRAMVLMSTATPGELVDPELPPRRLLFRLFHEDGVRVFETHPLEARCRCSRERIAGILRSLPEGGHRRDAPGPGHHRHLRVLQHQLRIHRRRPRAARTRSGVGKFPASRKFAVFRAGWRKNSTDLAGFGRNSGYRSREIFTPKQGSAARDQRIAHPRRSLCRVRPVGRRWVCHRRRMRHECGDFIVDEKRQAVRAPVTARIVRLSR